MTKYNGTKVQQEDASDLAYWISKGAHDANIDSMIDLMTARRDLLNGKTNTTSDSTTTSYTRLASPPDIGSRVRIESPRHPKFHGVEGTVIRLNAKTVTLEDCGSRAPRGIRAPYSLLRSTK